MRQWRVVGLLFFVTSRGIRNTVLSVVPFALPFLVVLAIGVNQAAPDFVRSVNDRMFSDVETDANVQWRLQANRAVLEQFREQPLYGVGFGRTSEFFIEVENETTGLPASNGSRSAKIHTTDTYSFWLGAASWRWGHSRCSWASSRSMQRGGIETTPTHRHA